MSSINVEMFKSYDIRFKECNLNKKLKLRLSESIAVFIKDYLKIKSVVICRDTRLYVPELAEIVADTLVDSGIDVFLNPLPISTCQFYYTCMQHKNSAGLMFTASHNPGEYLGIKLVEKNLIPISMESGTQGGLKTIKELYIKNVKHQKANKLGKVTIVNELDSYIDYSMRLAGVKAGSLSGLNIQFEFLNGSAGMEEALAFQRAGANIVLRHIIPNGLFPQGDPNPIIESSIAPARKAMKNGNSVLGFCFDGDGDRMDVMDKNGNQIVPSHNFSIIVPYIKKEIFKDSKTHILCDVKTLPNSMIEISKKGIIPHITRNGHSFIKAKLKDLVSKGYFAAVEESGHYYMCFPYDSDSDSNKASSFAVTESSLFYALLTARCYKENPKLYEPRKETVFRAREWSTHFEKKKKTMQDTIEEINGAMTSIGAKIINTMDDGSNLDASLIRYNLPNTFTSDSDIDSKKWFQIMLKTSRSEDSLLRCEVASNNKKLCQDIKNRIMDIIES